METFTLSRRELQRPGLLKTPGQRQRRAGIALASRFPMRMWARLVVVLVGLASTAYAEPVAVRFPESATRGFLVVTDETGGTLGHGELIQTVKGDRIESQLVLRFADGSLSDEVVTFSQRRVFRLLTYRLVQRGPAFPEPSDVSFDRARGRYRARVGDKTAEGSLDLPEDVHNGMTVVLLKNLPEGAGASGHLVALTPKPQLVQTTFRRDGDDRVVAGGLTRTAARYLVTLDIPGLKGVLATLVGKDPPDLRYWVLGGSAPTFLKFEGPLFFKGPRWTVALAAPRWPAGASR